MLHNTVFCSKSVDFVGMDTNYNDVPETHSAGVKTKLSQREKALLFYLSSILHLDGDSLVREFHEEPHQLHDE